MKKTAVIQVRVSSKKQADKELPIDSQIERCKQKAASLNADVLKVFVEEGKSAYYSNRPGFEESLVFCERNLPDYFITWSTARFSRTQMVSVQSRYRLEKCGVEIVYVSFDAGSDPDTRFLTVGLHELIDEYSSRQTAKDTKRSMQRNAALGNFNGGRPPYGYKVITVDKHKKLSINDTEKNIVKLIFKLRLQGVGAKLIAEQLRDKGFKNRDLQWNKSSVANLLRNHAVNGCIVFGRKNRRSGRINPKFEWTIVKSHEAIISDSDFTMVQQIMDEATTVYDSGSPRSGYLFTGLMRCACCGSSMQIETATSSTKKTYSYYNCRGFLKNGICKSRRIPADKLDECIMSSVKSRVFCKENLVVVFKEMNKQISNWQDQKNKRIDELNSDVLRLDAENESLMDSMIIAQQNNIEALSIIKRIQANETKIQNLSEDIRKVATMAEPEITIKNDQFESMTAHLINIIDNVAGIKKIRNFLQIVLKEVIIDDDKVTISYRPDMLTATKQKFAAEVEWLPETGSNCRPSD